MANLSNETRKVQILTFLTLRKGEWVDGPELANERIGGSEGLRRLRELRDDGYIIQQRRHPEPGRDIWQYRLVDPAAPPLKPDATITPPKQPAAKPTEAKRPTFGSHLICPTCQARRMKCDRCGGKGFIDRVPGM